MKLFQVACGSVLLLLLGFGLAIAGFALAAPASRTALQVLAILALAAAFGAGRRVLHHCRTMLDEA